MKTLPVVTMWKLLKMTKKQQIKFIKSNLAYKEFMELIYLGYHTSIDFRFKLEEVKPRPQVPTDYHSMFFSLAMSAVTNPFDVDKREELKEFIQSTDALSQYIYAKIINKSLGLSRNDLEYSIPRLIVKEPYELIADFGSPKFPCIIQTYTKGTEAIITIGDLGIIRDINVLKDKGGMIISGFDKHVLAVKNLGLKGTFNVVISGTNEDIFIEHALGNDTRSATNEPITIIDYQIPNNLVSRLVAVEIALIEYPQSLVNLARGFWVRDLDKIANNLGHTKAVARQDISPVLREVGTHSIDVSFLL